MSFLSNIQQQLQETSQQLSNSINSLNLGETAASLSTKVQSNLTNLEKEVSNLKPILARTSRSLQEKFGGIQDISELPQEYKDLECRVDNIREFYRKVLEITGNYELEAYDNPNNLKESFADYGSLINQKIVELSSASTAQEAEKVLTSGRKDKTPRTFAHQFAKSMNKARADILANKPVSLIPKTNEPESFEGEDTTLTLALEKIAEYETKIGNERLEQDKLIIVEFNSKINGLLKEEFTKCSKLRSNVETARLNFDTVRSQIRTTQNGDETVVVPEELTKKLEKCEDELVNATEIAVEAMKELIKPLESVNLMKLLFKIQLTYHKNVTKYLEELIDNLESISLEEDD
ncbi:unnamed protein product [Pichia kudriavzevii]